MKSKPIRVPEALHQTLKIDAAKLGIQLQDFVVQLLTIGRKAIRRAAK